MPLNRRIFLLIVSLMLGGVTGCATYSFDEPVEVNVVGIEPLQGEGLEVRMLLKLRIQNPNNASLDYSGVSVQMDVQGKRFATGVSNEEGTIERYGETLVEIPVSISAFGIARQAAGVARDDFQGKLPYVIRGHLAGDYFDKGSFRTEGEIDLPVKLY